MNLINIQNENVTFSTVRMKRNKLPRCLIDFGFIWAAKTNISYKWRSWCFVCYVRLAIPLHSIWNESVSGDDDNEYFSALSCYSLATCEFQITILYVWWYYYCYYYKSIVFAVCVGGSTSFSTAINSMLKQITGNKRTDYIRKYVCVRAEAHVWERVRVWVLCFLESCIFVIANYCEAQQGETKESDDGWRRPREKCWYHKKYYKL